MRRLALIFIALLLFVQSVLSAQDRGRYVTVRYCFDGREYSAVVNRKGWKESKVVRLCSSDQLTQMPQNHELYYEKNAKEAFRCFFAPIERYLKRGETVCYSPKGMLYFCNLDALMDESGKRLCDKYRFFRLSDINSIPSDPKKHIYDNINLFGGMDYEANPNHMNSEAWFLHTDDMQPFYEDVKGVDVSDIDFGTAKDGTRAGFSNLKCSKGEIKFIHLLDPQFSQAHTGPSAMEELFRLESRRNSEYLMHVSTHTFNMNVPFAESDTPDERYDKYMRSVGLLFSGAAHTLRGEKIPFRLNDGLLYAEEIASLDMSHCSLIVLAACNTALGEVTQDGIVGLQTAFKEAGAQTLLMTLWSVNDRATSEFMKRFYTYLFAGKSKHDSLFLARRDLMLSDDFSDPIYWAPFIMLD